MRKSSLPVGVKTLMKYHEGGTLDLGNPVQRAAGQWNNLQQSLLIHSMLADFIIPNLYFSKVQKEGGTVLSVLDGLQRLDTVFHFCQDGFILHPKTPDVILDGVAYKIALKKFSELAEDVKSAILGYRFTSYQLEDCTDEEIEETFARLNSGTPLSKIQQARPVLGVSLAAFFNRLAAHDFFQKSLNLTIAQLRREDDFLILLTAAMLLEDLHYGDFKIKVTASAAECVRFAGEVRDDYAQEKMELLEGVVGYLDGAFGSREYKFLRKNNAPVVMYVAVDAMGHGVSAEDYGRCVEGFFEGGCTEGYNAASGSGNVKMVNVETRLRELAGYVRAQFPENFPKEGGTGGEGVVNRDVAAESDEEEG